MVLTLQAIGLGGLYFNGLNRWSILGAFADAGIDGLEFRFVHDDRWKTSIANLAPTSRRMPTTWNAGMEGLPAEAAAGSVEGDAVRCPDDSRGMP